MFPCDSFLYNSVLSPTSSTASAYSDSLNQIQFSKKDPLYPYKGILGSLETWISEPISTLRSTDPHETHGMGTQGTAKWTKVVQSKAAGMSLVS